MSKLLLPLNIQLFAEESNASPESVAPETNTEGANTSVNQEEGVANPQPPVEKPVQSQEENAKYAAARRQAEAEKKKIEEENRILKSQLTNLTSSLSLYDYKGSPEEIADQIKATKTGRDVEQVRQERELAERKALENQSLQEELNELKQYKYQKLIAEDIENIKAAHPEAQIKDLSDLGEDYLRIMQTGVVDSVTAYEILQARKVKSEVKIPPVIGATNTSTIQEKDFYTSEEVDKLSDKDLDDPKIFEKVRKSMLKWK